MANEQGGTVTTEVVVEQPGLATEQGVVVEEVKKEGEAAVVEGTEEEKPVEEVKEGEEPPVKVDAQTRVREALEKAKVEAQERVRADARVAALEKEFAELKAKALPEAKPYVELTLEQVEAKVMSMDEEVAKLELEGRKLEARIVQRQLDKFLDFVEENEKKREEYQAKESAKERDKEHNDQTIAALDEAASFYREQRKIPKEVWDSAGLWLEGHFQENPLKGREFAEIMERRGPMAAFEWAERYVAGHFTAAVEEERKKTEQAKSASLGGGGAAPVTKTVNPDEEPIEDYFKRREQELLNKK